MTARLDLPPVICFRVTRYCNARCGFCLAPPDGAHPSADSLVARLDWLRSRGVKTVHFCGGEPTIHPALPQLVAHVRDRGGKTRLTTNGIAVSEALLAVLRAADAQVKVSLHGDARHHDAIVGCEAFGKATDTLRRLLASGVGTSVQTTVVAGGEWVVEWMAAFCLEMGVRRLSILPFIPRGSGRSRRGEYELSSAERSRLRRLVGDRRRALSGRLDLRWLDFTARPIHVAEADGRLILEGATEALDEVLGHIPEGAKGSSCSSGSPGGSSDGSWDPSPGSRARTAPASGTSPRGRGSGRR
jgi:MoaA/NifB/PqqE/SkfB family radical SAM enzyme